eukprot:XP_001700228.1 predicted protein [Chlamydomonas reinhardtii]
MFTRPEYNADDQMQETLGLAIRGSIAVPYMSWAVPSAEALEVIAQVSGGRVVEVCDGPEFLARHGGCPDRALLLCWARHDMGEASLAAYRGDTVVAVGEVQQGATWELDRELHPEWRQVRRVPLPNWTGIHDDLRVYRRRVAERKEEEGGN